MIASLIFQSLLENVQALPSWAFLHAIKKTLPEGRAASRSRRVKGQKALRMGLFFV